MARYSVLASDHGMFDLITLAHAGADGKRNQ